MDMSCYILSTSPFVKLAYLPTQRLFIGYQNYATTTGNPAVAAAATAARFPGQPALAATPSVAASGYHTTTAPLPGGNVTVSPSALAGGPTSSPGNTAQLPAGGHYTSPQQANTNPYRGPSPGFNSHQYQGFPSASSPPGRGYKRKSEDSAQSDSGDTKDSASRHSSTGPNEYYKLYCKVCRVTLNAPAQAKQHYEGKAHAKRAKLHDDGDEVKKTTDSTSSPPSTPQKSATASPNNNKPSSKSESNPSSSTSSSTTNTTAPSSAAVSSSTASITADSSTSSSSSSTSCSTSTTVTSSSSSTTTTTTADIHPDVYCKTCGVSFNSTKQANQHYEGKNHKKKLRASLKANRYDRKAAMAGAKYSCNVCRKIMTSQEQLNVHLKGAWHAMQVKTVEKSSAKALRGAWASWTHPKHSGEYMNGMLKPLGFAAAGSLGSQIPLQPANLNPGLLKLRPAGLTAAAPMCTLNGQLNGLNGLNGLSNGLAANGLNGLSTGAINGFSGWTTLPQM